MTPKQLAAKASSASPEESIDVAALLSRAKANEAAIVADPGSERVQVWVIENFDKTEVHASKHGQFYGGDSYIVCFSYQKRGKNAAILYFWLGRDSTSDEMGTAALLTSNMDKEQFGGSAVQVRVTQGKEPMHFRSLFNGRLVVHAGGKASAYNNVAATDSYDTDGVALFHVRGTNATNTQAVQVPETAASLNGADCFVLVSPGAVHVWKGSEANADELATATSVAEALAGDFLGKGGRSVAAVSEGEESDEFWALLGGKGEYSRTGAGADLPREPRLFQGTWEWVVGWGSAFRFVLLPARALSLSLTPLPPTSSPLTTPQPPTPPAPSASLRSSPSIRPT
jgi:hypothetical protein